MELTGLLTAVLILLSCCYFIFSTWKTMYRKRGLPPGPTPLPMIGNLLNMRMGSMVNSFVKLSEQYGSVYTLYFGLNPIIVICGYEAVKEALINQNDEFCGRGKLPTIGQFTKDYGLSLANGERWKKMRTFAFKTLRDFGLGKRSNEWKIQEEARCVVEEFRKSQGRPLNPSAMFMDAFSNILCSILFGERYDYTDRRFKKLLFIAEEIFRLTSSPWGQVQTILPTLMSYIPGPHHKAVSFSEEMVEFVAEIVKSCQQTLDLSKPKHFVDCFLIKMEKEKDDPNTEFTMKNLLYTIHNLFLAATETLSISLRHALLSLLVYPEIEGVRTFWRRGHLPPGPGPSTWSVLELRGSNIVNSLLKMREKYGDVFTIYLGSRPVVVVNGYDAVKEVYVDRADDFLARGDIAASDTSYHNYGIAFTSDLNRWKELRRFSLSTMRTFGMGKKNIEHYIIEEAHCLVSELKKTKETFFDPKLFFYKVSGNIVFSIMFGHRHHYEDTELLDVINTMAETFHIISSRWGQVFEMLPRIMMFVPGKHQQILSNMQKLLQYVKKKVEKNKETLDPLHPRDYVDSFLIKMEKARSVRKLIASLAETEAPKCKTGIRCHSQML